jgi:hypothetical protein
MAIDTAAKRFSIMEDETTTPAIPMPDATISAGDRQWFLWSYSGILWGAVVNVYNWVIQASAVSDGLLRTISIMADNSASVLDIGSAASSGGAFEFQANSSPANGERRLAFVHNWDGNTATTELKGGAAIAEAVLQ